MLQRWTKKLWQDRQVKSFIILFLVILSIFVIAPFLDATNPLADINNRLELSFAIILLWGIINWWHLSRERARFKALRPGELNDAILIVCTNVRENVKAAVQFLKERLTSSFAGFRAFHRVPWYLVIGNAKSGKTQLLAKSDLGFLAREKFVQLTPEGLDTASAINWWFAPSAVLLDVPGSYLEQQKELTPARAGWLELLRQLKQVRWRQPINGVVLVIDVETLLGEKQVDALALSTFRARLQEMAHRLKQRFPVYLVCSQADKIQGFTAYFDDLGQSERQKDLGITLPLHVKGSLVECFAKEFDRFIENLHQRVLWRIHHEREASKRNLVLQFPQQLSFLRESLQRIIYDLSNLSDQIVLRGIYFSSAIAQEESKIDQITENVSKQFALISPQHNAMSLRPQQAYFVKHLFEQRIFPEAALANDTLRALASKQEQFIRLVSLGFASAILVSVAIIWSQHYQQQTQQLNTASAAIADYKLLTLTYNPANAQLEKLLPALNALRLAMDTTENANLPWLLRFQLHHHAPLPAIISQIYQDDLKTRLIPAVRDLIANQLQSGNTTDSASLYSLFKTYLMLGDPTHANTQYLQSWFLHNWQDPHAKDQQLMAHLLTALSNTVPSLAPDQNLVTQIRSTLNALPYPLLSNAILRSELSPQTFSPIAANEAQHTFILPQQGIMQIYTVNQLNNQDQLINNALMAAVNGNWILGHKTGENISAATVEQLRASLMDDYAQDYANAWQNWLGQVQLKDFKTLNDLNLALEELTSNHSPLISLLQSVANNTDMNSARSSDKVLMTALQNHLTPIAPFVNFVNPSNTADQQHLKTIMAALQQLQLQVHAIMVSKTPNVTALKIMQQNALNIDGNPITQLTQLANQAPSPLNDWLSRIAESGRDLIFNQAQVYIVQQWQHQVQPMCASQVANHYPIVSSSDTDMGVQQFQQFFAPAGLMNQFYQNNLAPFVDTTHARWQWKNVNGRYISQDNGSLSQFERANIVQKLYFDSKGQLNVPFHLQLVWISPDVKSVALQMGNKTIDEIPDQDALFNWPLNTQNASVTIIDQNGGRHALAMNGNWALFKLIDAAQFKPHADGKTYDLNINVDGYKADYLLTAASPLNPFIPNVINQFACPSLNN